MSGIEHARVETAAGVASLRDLAEGEIGAIVSYWHEGGADLAYLGIDMARLVDPQATYERFRRALRTGDPEQRNLVFAIALDGVMVGFTLLNQYTSETNYSHWHIIAKDRRAAGLSTALYPFRIRTYFETTNMARLIHQTRTRNVGVNRMLDKYVPVAETAQIENPDGVALPGEFHLRYVTRADLPRLFARWEELRTGT